MTSSGAPISEYPFIRTGLLGFIGPAGLVFVVGKMDGLMVVSGRRHNADDIVATALAVEPMKFVYRGRFVKACSSVFNITEFKVILQVKTENAARAINTAIARNGATIQAVKSHLCFPHSLGIHKRFHGRSLL